MRQTVEKILKKVHSSKNLTRCLLLYSHSVVALAVFAFIVLIYRSWRISELSALKVALILAIPFLAVTLIRRLVNAPRPYQLYDFYGTVPKVKEGESYPSRHAFSVFAIGTVTVPIFPAVGISLLILGVGLCIARVLLGIHFIKDVAAGALCGVFTSVIGILITNPF